MSSSRGRGRRNRGTGDGWDEWGGYMNAKIQKLENQYDEDSSKLPNKLTDIFKGISIFVNGYTKPPSDVLKMLMQKHGGVYHHYYRREKVSHIIATNLPNSKISALTAQKVVKPDWITDSIAAGKLLPYQDYLLYTAKSKAQPSLKDKLSEQGQISLKQNIQEMLHGKDDSSSVVSGVNNYSDTKNINQDNINESGSNAGDSHTGFLSCNDDKNSRCALNLRESEVDTVWGNTCGSSADQIDYLSRNDLEKATHSGKHTAVKQHKSVDLPPDNCMTERNKKISYHGSAKAGDPTFVTEFYNHSRLHHLSTWGAEFKAYVGSLQAKLTEFPAQDKLRQIVQKKLECGNYMENNSADFGRVIMHIDMDCFFVSVGLRNRNYLKGKPVAVTHSRGQHGQSKDGEHGEIIGMTSSEDTFYSMAEIASCSYEARACGVKNGMFMGQARKLCPDLIPIPYEFEGYNQVSKILYDSIASLTCDIEAVSCDELFVDCTSVLESTGATPLELATMLRQDIAQATKCNASAGLVKKDLMD